jgi:hypothetical protein
VALGGEHRAEHARRGRHHQHAGPGAHQHKPAAAPRVLERQLLGEPSPREAEDVEAPVTEPVEQASDETGEQWDVVRHLRRRRTACAGYVEADHRGWSSSRLAPMPLHSTSGGPVDRCLRGGRVDQRDVARSDRLDEVVEEEARPSAVARGQVRVRQQLLGGPASCQVELDQSPEQGVVRPGDVGEAAVPASGCERRPADEDAAGFRAQLAQPARRCPGAAHQGGRPLRRRHVGEKAPRRADSGVDEDGVQGSGGLGRGATGDAHHGLLECAARVSLTLKITS